LGIWKLTVFQKKLGAKLFIFTPPKKKIASSFLPSFGPRVHFRGQKLEFLQKKLKNKKLPLKKKKKV
jgi:hypothetical protein